MKASPDILLDDDWVGENFFNPGLQCTAGGTDLDSSRIINEQDGNPHGSAKKKLRRERFTERFVPCAANGNVVEGERNLAGLFGCL